MHRLDSSCALIVATAIAGLGCGNVESNTPELMYPVPVSYQTRVEVVQPGAAISPVSNAHIIITTARKLDRPTEVIGVLDEHEPSGRQDAAFALLRSRAAAMGADAVVGVEFHHGEEAGESTHLAGLAVRFTDGPRPGEWR